MPYRENLQNEAIGEDANDHMAMPLGLYVPRNVTVTPKDIYAPIFATSVWNAAENGFKDGVDTVCGFDFFTGDLESLLYLTSHLFLAFLPNRIVSAMMNKPWLFTIAKNVVRSLVSLVNVPITLVTRGRLVYTTAILKFSPATAGRYEGNGSNGITLGWFQDEQDKAIAKKIIKDQLHFFKNLGKKPHPLIRFIYRLVTKVPFCESQVDAYVENYSKNALLSQQHMAGGCLFGKAIDRGLAEPRQTGLVFGTSNVHVADLSAVPLPRVSPQMTAYLIGYHVSTQLSK